MLPVVLVLNRFPNLRASVDVDGVAARTVRSALACDADPSTMQRWTAFEADIRNRQPRDVVALYAWPVWVAQSIDAIAKRAQAVFYPDRVAFTVPMSEDFVAQLRMIVIFHDVVRESAATAGQWDE